MKLLELLEVETAESGYNTKTALPGLINNLTTQTLIYTQASSLNLDGQLLHFTTAKHVHYTELL